MVSGASNSYVDAASTGEMRGVGSKVSSPETPSFKNRHFVLEAEGDVIRDIDEIGSLILTARPVQPDVNTHGSGTQAGNMHGARAESHFDDTSKAIPFRFSASTSQPEGTEDGCPLGDAGFYEATDIAQNEQKTGATGSPDVLGQSAFSSPPIDARQVEDSAMSDLAFPNVIDEQRHEETQEQPHEKHEAITAGNVTTIADTESKKENTAIFEGIDEDTLTWSLPQPPHESPTQSSSTSVTQPPSKEGKQVKLAPETSASENRPVTPSRGARSMKTTSEAQTQPAPSTPPPKPSKTLSSSSATRRTRTPKDAFQAADTWSPPTAQSAKKATQATATQTASPTPRKRPIKIILHYKRKSKGKSDAPVASQSEAVGESTPESTEISGDAHELSADADENADSEEEVMLL